MNRLGEFKGTRIHGVLPLICAILVAVLYPTQPAVGQVLYGSLVGNVTDANGAVVPGAAVMATNQRTGNSTSNGKRIRRELISS